MHFEGQQTINAPIQRVWAFLTDPHSVASCTPGFMSMEILSPTHFKSTVGVGVGAVKAKFTLDVTMEDVQEPNHATAVARGNAGGSAAEVRGGMDLAAESDTVTNMKWAADVNVMGTIATVGARLLEGTAHKLTARFFECFKTKLEAPATAAAAEPTDSASSASPAPSTETS
ncbi:MAG TPA: carbon monoxide dehydrogenase subunit G [Ktedonobacterales bacterium]|jgi:carbon monoxide dehydrogenase subunit G|nr:carbon monoxide dehydrogenase subunit G [Ktedonobacterales bacterium]